MDKKIPYGYFIEDLENISDTDIRTNLRTSLEKLVPNYTDETIIISREQDFAYIKGYAQCRPR